MSHFPIEVASSQSGLKSHSYYDSRLGLTVEDNIYRCRFSENGRNKSSKYMETSNALLCSAAPWIFEGNYVITGYHLRYKYIVATDSALITVSNNDIDILNIDGPATGTQAYEIEANVLADNPSIKAYLNNTDVTDLIFELYLKKIV